MTANAQPAHQLVDTTTATLPSTQRHLWVVPAETDRPGTAPRKGADGRAAAWSRLLVFISNGVGDQGAAYERTRTRLMEFFRGKGALNAEDLADATFDRLAEKLEAEHLVTVQRPLGYVLRFARFIYLESIKTDTCHRRCLQTMAHEPGDDDAGDEGDGRMAALRRCLEELSAEERTMLAAYYRHNGRERINSRLEMSKTLGLSPALLRTRMARLRAEVERRVRVEIGE
jgi:DNA-directed RNA polymerase specialized sigma24 family protein